MGKNFDVAYVLTAVRKLIPALPFTLSVIAVSGLLGFALGVLVTALRVRKHSLFHQKALYALVMLYVLLERSTPGLIQLFLIFYGLPVILTTLLGVDISHWSRTLFAVVAFVLHNGAYVSDVLRPAYLAVGKGQHDAADSVGMSSLQKIRRIIGPQMLPIALPGLGNLLIQLIKDTSLLFTIGVVDLMGKAKNINTNNFGVAQLEVYISVSLVYWALITLANAGIRKLEKRYRHAGFL
jgi:L-cystine transport system permease protein